MGWCRVIQTHSLLCGNANLRWMCVLSRDKRRWALCCSQGSHTSDKHRRTSVHIGEDALYDVAPLRWMCVLSCDELQALPGLYPGQYHIIRHTEECITRVHPHSCNATQSNKITIEIEWEFPLKTATEYRQNTEMLGEKLRPRLFLRTSRGVLGTVREGGVEGLSSLKHWE